MIDIKKIQVVTYCDSDWDSVKTQISDNWESLPICGNADAVNEQMVNAIKAVQGGERWRNYQFLYYKEKTGTIFAYCYVQGASECATPNNVDDVAAQQMVYFSQFFGVPFGMKGLLQCSKKIQGKLNPTT